MILFSRRALLHLLRAALAALLAWPVLRFVTWREPAEREVVFTREELRSGEIIHKDEVFLVPGEQEPLALSARCSHLGCLVSWDPLRAEFHCPCHGSVYDARGNRLAGPTEKGLARLETKKLDTGGLAVKAPV